MSAGPELLLVGAVAAVGVLHTIVPDHWVPIMLIARQRGWSKSQTARAALQAGVGHVTSTLLIALVVWLAGVAVAARFGHVVDAAASLALIGFGGWIAIAAWRELRSEAGHGHAHRHGHTHGHGAQFAAHSQDVAHSHDHEEDHGHGEDHGYAGHEDAPDPADDPLYAPLRGDTAVLTRHRHAHRHGRGAAHSHWHDHRPETAHPLSAGTDIDPPPHEHLHKTSGRTALLLVLGSSPMVEGIPAFFAAGRYGIGLIVTMSIVFALATIVTYVLLCVVSAAGLQRVRLGAIERYGEVLSGAFIATVGVVFWISPVL